MEKQFSISLRVNARVDDVVAEVGAFADYLVGKFGTGISDMTVDTTVQGWNEAPGIVVGAPPPTTFTPSPELSSAPPPPSRRTRKAKGYVPPETPPADLPCAVTTDEHPDLAEAQAEVEGADVEAEDFRRDDSYDDVKPEPKPDPQPELTRDDVFEALRRLVTTKGNDAAVAALASVGVKKFSDVPTTALPELYAAIQKVLA